MSKTHKVWLAASGRVPIYIVVEPRSSGQRGPSHGRELSEVLERLNPPLLSELDLIRAECRAVSIDRLETILEKGCDVIPTDSTIFVSDIGKAAEYGGEEIVIQFFDPGLLAPTYCEVPSTTPPEELDALRKIYRTELPTVDGTTIWFSKVDSSRAAKSYETEYGRCIPGNPWQALKMIWLVGRDGDRLRSRLTAAIARLDYFQLST